MIFDLIKSWNWGFQQNIKIVSLNFSHFFTKRITKIFCKKTSKNLLKIPQVFISFRKIRFCEKMQNFAKNLQFTKFVILSEK